MRLTTVPRTAGLLLLMLWPAAHALGAATLIQFEDLSPSGPGTPATVVVSDQYAALGVRFSRTVALDYSVGTAVPGFAHSGSKAIEACYAVEFCRAPIAITFDNPQARVKVWAGQYREFGGPTVRVQVRLRALAADDTELGRATTIFDPSGRQSVPIGSPLEVALASAAIARVEVNLARERDGVWEISQTNGLALDDIEFDTSPPDPCAAANPPGVSVDAPPDQGDVDQTIFSVFGNRLVVVGSVSTPSILTAAVLTVTGPSGETRSRSLLGGEGALSPFGGSFSAQIPDVLFPGLNQVAVRASNCRGEGVVARTIELRLPNITAAAVEVTQGIQNLANEIPVIVDKTTYARLVLRTTDSQGLRVPAGNAVLRLTRGAESVELAPINLSNAEGGVFAFQDGGRDLSHGYFLFWIPREWQKGTVSFEATVRPSAGDDARADDNTAAATVTFQVGGRFCVDFVTMHSHRGRYTMDDPTFWPTVGRMLRYMPVSEVDGIRYFRGRRTVQPHFHETVGVHRNWASPWDVASALWYYNLWTNDPSGCRTLYYGLVPNDFELADVGYGFYDGDEAWGKMPAGFDGVRESGETMAHEIGHNLNLHHVDCPVGTTDKPDRGYPFNSCQIDDNADGFFGFDPDLRVPMPPLSTADFMSYNAPKWLSSWSYCKLLAKIPPRSGTPRVRCPSTVPAFDALDAPEEPDVSDALSDESRSEPGGSDPGTLTSDNSDAEHIAITATFDRTASVVRWGSLYRLTKPEPSLFEHPGVPLPGDTYEIAFLDRSGRTVGSHAVNPRELIQPTSEAAFFQVLPFEPQTARILLRRNGVTVGAREVSRSRPKVSLTRAQLKRSSDAKHESSGGTLEVRWTASDADGEALRFTVQYSADDGKTWQALAVDVTGTGFDTGTDELRGGRKARIRVIATDGVNTATATSAPFEVARKAPRAVIVSPSPQARTVSFGVPIVLRGIAVSVDQDVFAESAFCWSSSLDGQLGTGREILAQRLSAGRHRITLKVQDDRGKLSSVSTTLTVEDGKS